MDVFSFALEKEMAAEKLYRQLAESTESEGLNNIFTRLADMERHHIAVVAAMRDRADVKLDTESLDSVRSMLNRLADEKDYLPEDPKQQKEVYEKVRQMEKESIDLYLQQARENDDEAIRNTFLQLAEQEKMHYILIDNILEFVTKPDIWCENAEFSHIMDKYRGTAYYPGMLEYEI